MASLIKVLAVLALVVLSVMYYPFMTPESISSFMEEHRLTAPFIFISVCMLRPVLFFLPSMGLTVIGGVLFGAVWGTLYVAIGGALSTATGYYFAKWLGRDAMKRLALASGRLKKMDEWARSHGGNAVLSMRLFNLPWDIVSYWAGISGVHFGKFYVASMIPLLPVSFLYTYFGSRIFAPESPGFIISLAIMFILGAVPFVMNKIKKTRTNK